jgi:ABC-type multidrug transport system ATPase subunit
MSGGQKQRVSLCRAVYSDSDVYILDDVLSAVDAHVGHHIMHECIVGALKDKTRVLVLHQMQWIHHADYVAVIEDGTVAHFGKYTELKERGVDFEKFVTKKKDEEASDEIPVLDDTTQQAGMSTPSADRGFGRKDDGKGGKLTSAEDREVGKVRTEVFAAYLKAVGPFTTSMILGGVILYQFTRTCSL